MEELKQIGLNEIHPHPQNPRRDLGDVSELTESIKKNGIMQNLTVIPGHWDEKGKHHEEGYTLLIGHRRYKASMAAGIDSVPCRIITGMDEREQLSTMLEENMQRADLTVWEQAQGFQMMLDLGDTEDDLAEKTGFSKQTIKHRLQIAKLDSKLLKKKEDDKSFQLTLSDLYELEKIKDIKRRNEVLKNCHSSRDLAWRAKTAAGEEKRDENYKVFESLCKAAGIKEAPEKVKNERWGDKWEIVFEVDLEANKKIELPKKIDKEKKEALFFIRWYGNYAASIIKLAGKKEKKKTKYEIEQEKKAQAQKEVKSRLKALMKKKDVFIKEIIEGKIEGIKETQEDLREIFDCITKLETWVSDHQLLAYLAEKEFYKCTEEEINAAREKAKSLKLIEKMLILMANTMDERKERVIGWRGNFEKAPAVALMECFKVLEKWGWSFTEDEEALLNGECDLYVKEQNNEN